MTPRDYLNAEIRKANIQEEEAYEATEAIAGKYGAAGIDWIREALAEAYQAGKNHEAATWEQALKAETHAE